MSRPLCPHCFEDDCLWLSKHEMGFPADSACPYFGKPLSPGVAERLRERIDPAPTIAPPRE